MLRCWAVPTYRSVVNQDVERGHTAPVKKIVYYCARISSAEIECTVVFWLDVLGQRGRKRPPADTQHSCARTSILDGQGATDAGAGAGDQNCWHCLFIH